MQSYAIIAAKQGIDLSDQMSSYHTAVRKCVRWYHKVAEELILGTCVVNAWIIYNEHQAMLGKQAIQITEFREKIAQELLNSNQNKGNDIPTVSEKHFLTETDEREQGKRPDRRKRRCCVGCYNRICEKKGRQVAKSKAKKVTTECIGCPGKPRFCFTCFAKTHAALQ